MNVNATTDLAEIERRAADYRAARDTLRAAAAEANDAIEAAKRRHLPRLRQALEAAAACESALRDAVTHSSPDLWQRSRTRTIHGIKVGWQKQRGRVEFEDEAKVIERIRRLLPPEQAALLIRVREAVHKPAVYDLTAADLRRLGIAVSDDCDHVVIRDLASELDRALEALLAHVAEAEVAA